VSFTGIIEQKRTSASCSHVGHHSYKQASLFRKKKKKLFPLLIPLWKEIDSLNCQRPRLNFTSFTFEDRWWLIYLDCHLLARKYFHMNDPNVYQVAWLQKINKWLLLNPTPETHDLESNLG
jgi:hypothetical protein